MQLRLKAAKEAWEAQVQRLEAAYAKMEAAPKGSAEFKAAQSEFDQVRSDLEATKAEYERIRLVADSRAAAGVGLAGGVRVTGEPKTYDKGSPFSIFRDMLGAYMGDLACSRRLEAHKNETRVDRPAAFERAVAWQNGRAAAQFDLSSTDSAGGYLVAPLHLQEQFIGLPRAGRPLANAIGSLELPADTDSITIPKLSTGTATATQSDGGAVQETDATLTEITIPVRTIAGMQDASQQVVDRSRPAVDQIIYGDLRADYDTKLEVQVINGNGTAPNARGLLQVSGIEAVTYTDASPTVAELYPKYSDAIWNRINTLRFIPPNLIVQHPRRWGWATAAVDSTGRPLVTQYNPQNAPAAVATLVAQGIVGEIQGVPVLVSASVPTNLGASTNEDISIVLNTADQVLMEDPEGPYLGLFPDIGSGTLTLRFRLHNYFAFSGERLPKSIATIGGTGFVTPTF